MQLKVSTSYLYLYAALSMCFAIAAKFSSILTYIPYSKRSLESLSLQSGLNSQHHIGWL
jgi:hypothetical protein